MRSLRSCNRRRRYRAAYERTWKRCLAGLAWLGITSMADIERLP